MCEDPQVIRVTLQSFSTWSELWLCECMVILNEVAKVT